MYDSTSSYTASYSLLEGINPAGDGNLDGTDSSLDPLLVSIPSTDNTPTTAGDFTLQAGSPLRDAGDSSAPGLDEITYDLAGNPRVMGAAVDIGAYEFAQLPELVVEYPAGTALESGASTLDFGSVEKLASQTFTLNLSNTGVADLADLDVTISGAGAGHYQVSPPQSTTLGASQSLSLAVTFSPTVLNPGPATLEISGSNLPDGPWTVALTGSGLPTIYRVDANVAPGGANDGTSWADAIQHLQDALAVAEDGDELWIAQGRYFPDRQGSADDNNRDHTFIIDQQISLYGGFQGNETSRDQRDPNQFVTVISGDITGDDNTDANGVTVSARQHNSSGSRKLMSLRDSCRLDGLAVCASTSVGLEILGHGSNGPELVVTLENCVIQAHSVYAVQINDGAELMARNSSFNHNDVQIYSPILAEDATLTFVNCEFLENQGDRGSALSLERCTAKIVGCTFKGNLADNRAAIHMDASSAEFVNCIISGNIVDRGSSNDVAGGIYAKGSSSMKIVNCTITRNHAARGGGIVLRETTAEIHNSLMWGNTARLSGDNLLVLGGVNFSAYHSLIEGEALTDNGNLDGTDPNMDPLLVDLPPASRAPTTAGDFTLQAGSPLRDAGDSSAPGLDEITYDLAGNPRVVGASVDIGAFEFQPQPELEVEYPETVSLTSGGTVEFGAIGEGTTASKTFYLSNPGTGTLENLTAALSGSGQTHFQIGTVPTELAESEGGTVSVTFAPQALGPHTATLTLESSSLAAPFTVTITGESADVTPPELVQFATAGDHHFSRHSTRLDLVLIFNEPLDLTKTPIIETSAPVQIFQHSYNQETVSLILEAILNDPGEEIAQVELVIKNLFDQAGNEITPISLPDVFSLDTLAPTFTLAPAAGQDDLSFDQTAVFELTASEAIGPPSVELTGSTVPGSLQFAVNGSGANWTIEVSGATGPGTVQVTVNDVTEARFHANISLNPNPITASLELSDIYTPSVALEMSGELVAEAGACGDLLGLPNSFNAMIFGNLTASNGGVGGRLAVAGTADLSGGFKAGQGNGGEPLPTFADAQFDTLIVGQDLYDSNWGINGNIVYGGTRHGAERHMKHGNLVKKITPVTLGPGGNVPADGSGSSFEALHLHLAWLSTMLGELSDKGVVSKTIAEPHQPVLQGNDPGLNIFNVDAVDWSSHRRSITLSVPVGSTALVNIHGSAVSMSQAGITLQGVDPRMVLFNYVDCTDLQTTAFRHPGSVLAPFADANLTSGAIEGRAFFGGDVEVSGFQFQNYPFIGIICPGMSYAYEITNDGETDLTDVTITQNCGTLSGDPIELAVDESDSTTFTSFRPLTPADLLSGAVTCEATVTALRAGGGGTVTDTASHEHLFIPGGTLPVPGDPVDPPDEGTPDFAVTGIHFDPAPQAPGDVFNAEVTVVNSGTASGDAGSLNIWLDHASPATTNEAGDAQSTVGHLEIGESKVVTFANLTAPANPGEFTFRAFVEVAGAVDEEREDNNQDTREYELTDPAEPEEPADWMKADFIISGIMLTPVPEAPGDDFIVKVTVQNTGHRDGDGGTLRLWLDKNSKSNPGQSGDAERPIGNLDAGQSRVFSFALEAPGTGGTKKLRVCADADDATPEYSSGNNWGIRVYELEAPLDPNNLPSWMKADLVVQSVTLEPSPSLPEARFTATVSVTNTGHIAGDGGTLALWHAADTYHGLSDTPDQSLDVGIVEVGEVRQFVFEDIRAPKDVGSYHTRAVIDYQDITIEHSSGNNHGGASYTLRPLELRMEMAPEGVKLFWNSSKGYVYTVERASTPAGPYTEIASGTKATPPENEYLDDNPPSGSSYYRVWGFR